MNNTRSSADGAVERAATGQLPGAQAAQLAVAQRAYVQAAARFAAADALHAQQLAAYSETDLDDLGEDALAMRREISRATGYWEAYDALYAAGTVLLRAARAWALAHPNEWDAAFPYRALLPWPVLAGQRDALILLAMQIEARV